jgi:NADPH:quinone reductase-like Zn-dependent oxidoreductase
MRAVPCRSPASAGPEVLDVVDITEPEPGPGQQLYDVSTAGVNYADTHHRRSAQQTV